MRPDPGGVSPLHRNGNALKVFCVAAVNKICTQLSAGFRGWGPGPQACHQQWSPTKPLNFWLMIDVSLVILIDDFEINEKLCTLAVSFHSLVNLCSR